VFILTRFHQPGRGGRNPLRPAGGGQELPCLPCPRTRSPQIEIPPDQPPSYQLELDDITVGKGEEAVAGRVVEVHYVGVSWSSGEQFDASWDRGDTFKFTLGKGKVIRGWDEGVAGMRVGGRRRITIPPNMAYGKRGAGGVIGPDETLVFVVDLMGVR
jgi:peptidylprolyl isomerase